MIAKSHVLVEREVSTPSARHQRVARPERATKNDLGFVLAAATSFALVVASLIVLVGVRTAQLQAGYRVHDLESEVLRLKQERAALDVERATLLRPQRLAELSRTSLGLVPADASRVVMDTSAHAPVPAAGAGAPVVDDGGGAR